MSVLAVYDDDLEYARNIATYISGRKENKFLVHTFSSFAGLTEYCSRNRIDILLISRNNVTKEIEHMDIEKIIVLSEGNIVAEDEQYHSVYKYQSADNIVRQIMSVYYEQNAGEYNVTGNCIIIGIYSPVKRCGKTSFAIGLAKTLSENERTLFISLETFSGLRGIMESDREDLSDLMYYFKQNEELFRRSFNNAISNMGTMDYVLPVSYGADIREVRTDEWFRMIGRLAVLGGYNNIVIDIGDAVCDVWTLLAQCNAIYMPRLEDSFSVGRIKEFEEFLLKTEREEILSKIRYIDVPMSGCIGEGVRNIKDISWSNVSRYVNSIVGEQIGGQRIKYM